MKNIFITGSGRSGTSMLAGIFNQAGYYFGDNLYPPRNANPKGFFEDAVINGINEDIIFNSLLAQNVDKETIYFLKKSYEGRMWLFNAPGDWKFHAIENETRCIQKMLEKQPFCYKDPRFCYTIDNWLAKSLDSVVLCIYRDPAVTVESILRECRTEPYLYPVNLGVETAFIIWCEMYLRMLNIYENHENIYFINYDEVISGDILPDLEKLTGASIDRSFPEGSLNRSTPSFEQNPRAKKIYDLLNSISKDGLFNVSREKHIQAFKKIQPEICTLDATIPIPCTTPLKLDELTDIVTSDFYRRTKELYTAEKHDLQRQLNENEHLSIKLKLEERIKNNNLKLLELNKKVNNKEKKISELRATLEKKERTAYEKVSIITELRNENKHKDLAIDEKVSIITDLRNEIRSEKTTICDLKKNIEDKITSINDSQNAINTSNELLKRLQKTTKDITIQKDRIIELKNKELEQKDGLISLYTSSRSWRMTAPLRWIGEIFSRNKTDKR